MIGSIQIYKTKEDTYNYYLKEVTSKIDSTHIYNLYIDVVNYIHNRYYWFPILKIQTQSNKYKLSVYWRYSIGEAVSLPDKMKREVDDYVKRFGKLLVFL